MKTKQRTEQRENENEQGSLWELWLFAVFFVVVFSAVARAEAQPQSSKKVAMAATAEPQSTATVSTSAPLRTVSEPVLKYSGSLLVSTSKAVTDSGSDSYSGLYRFGNALTHTPTGVKTSLRLGYARAYTYENDDGTDGMMENPLLIVSKAFANEKDFSSPIFDSVAIGIRGAVPGNRDSQKATFKGAVGPQVAVTKSIGILDIAETLYYTRQFFEYEMKDDGTLNSPDRFVTSTELALNVTKKIALTAALLVDFTTNYAGNTKAREISGIGIDLKPIEKLTVSLGYGIDRAALSADGQADAIKIYDENIAEASLDLFLEI